MLTLDVVTTYDATVADTCGACSDGPVTDDGTCLRCGAAQCLHCLAWGPDVRPRVERPFPSITVTAPRCDACAGDICDVCGGHDVHASWCPSGRAREIAVGALLPDGILLYPHTRGSDTSSVLFAAGWRWWPELRAWRGAGEPPVPFTRGRAS